MARSFHVGEKTQKWLGAAAIRVIETALANKPVEVFAPSAEEFDPEELAILMANGGVFVTLKINHNLRGCIGTILPYEPLFQNVHRMAYSAAFKDPRFLPLTQAEWPNCNVEISVLSDSSRCEDLNQIEIGRHGLILRYQSHSGVFLPQVPVEQGWNREQYLDHLCLKAGVVPGTWKKPECQIDWYEAFVFNVR